MLRKISKKNPEFGDLKIKEKKLKISIFEKEKNQQDQ